MAKGTLPTTAANVFYLGFKFINCHFSSTFLYYVSLSILLNSSFSVGQMENDEYMSLEELEYTYQSGERTTIEVVEGRNASLPCSVPLPLDDSPDITLWYIGTKQTPIYSFDQRGLGPSKKGSGWADPIIFGNQNYPNGVRVTYDETREPPSLIIYEVTKEDSKDYRCRVDFSKSTSQFAWIILKVVVPPKNIEILTERSPVKPGEINDIVCKVSGGIPPASVTWVQKGQIVDANYNVSAGVSFNSLEKPASRMDLSHAFVCTAHNNDITAPLIFTYNRNVTCGPLSMEVFSEPVQLSARRKGILKCKVAGSNPKPIITWYTHAQMIDSQNQTVIHGDNISTSILSFIPTRADHHAQYVCRAENPFAPLATMEKIVNLEVTYSPIIVLTIGWPLRPNSNKIREGSTVILECKIDANPRVYKTKWFKDDRMLPASDTQTMKIGYSTSTLELSKINREDYGRYQCFAANIEGDGFSNNITIKGRYAPICSRGPLVLGVSLGVPVNVTCRVEADPPPESFSWTFDPLNKKGSGKITRKALTRSSRTDWKYLNRGSESTLFYIARSARDYGILKCVGYNSVSKQRRPCIIKILSREDSNFIPEDNYHKSYVTSRPTTTTTTSTTSTTTTTKRMTTRKETTTTKRPTTVNTHRPRKTLRQPSSSAANYSPMLRKAPPQVRSCVVVNVTSHSAGITCQSGSFGHYQEKFLVQVWLKDSDSLESVFSKTLLNCAFFTITNLLASHLYTASITAFNSHGRARPRSFSLKTHKMVKVVKSLSSQDPPSSSIGLAMGVTAGVILVLVIIALGVLWFIKRPRTDSLPALSIRTLSKKDNNPKEKGTLIKATPVQEEATVNGVFEYTIYDSSGRYRGFSHLPPQAPGGRFPVPVATGDTLNDPTTSTSPEEGGISDPKDVDPNNKGNVKLKTSRGWAKLRVALVFIRNTNFKRIVHPRHNSETKDQESKI